MFRSLFALSAILVAVGCASTEADQIRPVQTSSEEAPQAELIAHDARLTRISKSILAISPSGTQQSMTYTIMYDACENALKSGASALYSRPKEQWEGAYCSCDTLLTLEGWLEDADMREKLSKVDYSDYESANAVLSNHKIFANDAYCRSMTERAANG